MHFDGSWFIPCLVNAIRRETSDLHGGASWCIVLHYRTRLIEPINVSLTVKLQQSHPRELARLGWLPRQAKLPLHGGWYRTGTVCHWPWNVKSTIRKSRASPTQTWIALEKLVQPLFDYGSWRLTQSCDSCAAVFAVKTWAQTGRLLEEEWDSLCTTSDISTWDLDRGRWWLSQSCDSLAAVFAVKIWAQWAK